MNNENDDSKVNAKLDAHPEHSVSKINLSRQILNAPHVWDFNRTGIPDNKLRIDNQTWRFKAEKLLVVQHSETIDFFISYRREKGGSTAALLYEVLKMNGLQGFFDARSLQDGNFADAIKQNILKAKNFILVVAPETLDSDYVKQEIDIAYTAGKKVIPIFVSGYNYFPADLDNERLIHENAIILKHDNFDECIGKLRKWMVTNKSQLVQNCLDRWKKQGENGLDTLVDVWRDLAGPAKVMEIASKELRSAWNDSNTSGGSHTVLASIPTGELKEIAKEMGVEHKGSRRAVLDTLEKWLAGKNPDFVEEDRKYKDGPERFYRLRDYIALQLKSRGSSQDLMSMIENVDHAIKGHKTSEKILQQVFNNPDLDFSEMLRCLPLEKTLVNELGAEFLETPPRSREEIFSALEDWVDYADKRS